MLIHPFSAVFMFCPPPSGCNHPLILLLISQMWAITVVLSCLGSVYLAGIRYRLGLKLKILENRAIPEVAAALHCRLSCTALY